MNNSTNYIHRLQNEVSSLTATQDTMNEGIDGLLSYLISDKFTNDPTVQVRDVMTRLYEIRRAAYDAGFEQGKAG